MTTPEERAATAETALAEALARVAELEAALSFYGDRGNWQRHDRAPYLVARAVMDSGDRARAALRGPGG